MRDVLIALQQDQFPQTVDVVDQMANYGSHDHHQRVLDQLLAGIRAEGS